MRRSGFAGGARGLKTDLELAPQVSPDLGCALALLSDGGCGVVRRHCSRTSLGINGDHGEIAGIRVPTLAGADVFGFDADPDFHRRPPGMIDRGAKGHELADMDRLAKDDLVH
ncbi:hypothetical protein D9M70_618580 [compost metagenome]